MKVSRIDVFDFNVVFSQEDFTNLSVIANDLGMTIEQTLDVILEASLDKRIESIKRKEQADELEAKDG